MKNLDRFAKASRNIKFVDSSVEYKTGGSLDQSSTVSLTIDSRVVTIHANERLIDVIVQIGIDLPRVCYHKTLGPIMTCDTCIVEVNGELVRACAEFVHDKSVISTSNTRARSAQENAISKLLGNHELYCTLCENNNGDCVVHNTVTNSKISHPAYPFKKKPYEIDDTHPFFRYDPNQCILCGRCVEACQDFQVNETLSINWALDVPRVVFDEGVDAIDSSCVGCGHCVTVCPCNALMEKSMLGEAGYFSAIAKSVSEPLIQITKALEPIIGIQPIVAISEAESLLRRAQIKKTKTVCTYCGVGCTFEAWTKGRKLLRIDPTIGPANSISTCIKGKFAWDYLNSNERLTSPLIRRSDHFEEVSWEEALEVIATRMGAIKDEFGPDSLGFISSSKCTNEESYLMQKLARSVVGTNNIDNCSRYCQSPATMGLLRTVGIGGDSGSISDIENAGLVILIGSNTAESHPVIAARIKRSHKMKGQRLIVADLRRHEMAERADIFLHPKPGTDLVWLSAVTKYIIDTGRADTAFIEANVDGFEKYCHSLADFDIINAAKICGVQESMLVDIADEIAGADGVAICWAMGVTQHCGGSDTSTSICNLLLITGNFAKHNCGAFPLRGHNNVQGASDFGSMPNYFPGYELVSDEKIREKWERGWATPLSSRGGLDNHEMVDAIHGSTLKSLYLIGEDMGIVDSNAMYVQDALAKLDFFVVQDLFFTKTAQFADVILPASPSMEKDGTFTNTERRIQRLYEVMKPLGDSMPDWKIIVEVANALGANWDYLSPAQIMSEAASLSDIFAGVTYERLEGYSSLQWPVLPDGTDTPLLFLDGFGFENRRARLIECAFIPASEGPNAEFDLHLNNGRLLEHFHEGNMTNKSAGISLRTPNTFVEVSPKLAHSRGIVDGATLRLVSARGSIKAKAVVTDRVSGNELYMPMNSSENESAINVLTSSETDRATHTPAYKELAVRIEVLGTDGVVALPRNNFRYASRKPQLGVQVEQKWARSDYVDPLTKLYREEDCHGATDSKN